MQLMINTFAPTLDSSWFSLREVDATVRLALFRFFRFSYKVGLVLTSPDAVRTYKTIYNLIALVVVVIWAVAVTIAKWIDNEAQVMVGEQPEQVEPAAESLIEEPEEVQKNINAARQHLLNEMSRAELLELAATLEGTPKALHLPRKMKDTRLRRKLYEAFAG